MCWLQVVHLLMKIWPYPSHIISDISETSAVINIATVTSTKWLHESCSLSEDALFVTLTFLYGIMRGLEVMICRTFRSQTIPKSFFKEEFFIEVFANAYNTRVQERRFLRRMVALLRFFQCVRLYGVRLGRQVGLHWMRWLPPPSPCSTETMPLHELFVTALNIIC